ncbi:MAG: energy-coupling factor transporter transmembrane protein EcfT [Desulfobacterales bacterium]|nr:MAG: energy-coupling factor transporter transmembrane protein EcfT [Desulfobacterales bacterium]
MTELTILGYCSGDSVLHKTDVRFKIACLIMISITTISANFWALSMLTLVLAVTFMHVGLSLTSAFKTLRYVFVLLMFIFIARILSSPGTPVFAFSKISVTREGIYDGVSICWRLLDVIVVGILFVSTTRSLEIKSAVAWLLHPIPFIPAKRVATMMSLVMRFMPVILDQARETADAQRARGVENRKNPIYRMSKLGIGLMRRTFERADKLAYAMEARCYSEERTDPALDSDSNDWIMLVFVMALCIAMTVV